MSHFYGTVEGSAGMATRQGSEKSGLQIMAASYDGCIEVALTAYPDGSDHFRIRMNRHGQSSGWVGEIASGTLGIEPERPGILPTPTHHVDQLRRIRAVMDGVNANSEPDAMGEALTQIERILAE